MNSNGYCGSGCFCYFCTGTNCDPLAPTGTFSSSAGEGESCNSASDVSGSTQVVNIAVKTSAGVIQRFTDGATSCDISRERRNVTVR